MARILYIVHQFLPRYFTGTEQYVHALATALQARGHEVEVLALEPDFGEFQPLCEWREELVGDLPVTRVRVWYHLDRDHDRMEFRHPWVAARFRDLLEQRRPDVVHAFHLRYLGVDLLHEARLLGIPCAVHLMDFWYLCPRVTLLRDDGALCDGPPEGGLGCLPCHRPELDRQLRRHQLHEVLATTATTLPADTPMRDEPFRRARLLLERPVAMRDALATATGVFAPSRFLRDTFARNGHPIARFEILPYGIDAADLLPLRERAPREPGAPLRCGFIGSIAAHKGTDVALQAVLDAGAGVVLTIHGRTEDFPDFARPLQHQADGSGGRARFAGPFGRAELPAVLADLDLLLVPSRWYENTPFVVLEAFAAGVPVLASDLGGLAEIVAHELCGELFRTGDSADLARRLRRLRDEPERLDRYRSNLPEPATLTSNAITLEAAYSRWLAAAPTDLRSTGTAAE